MDSQPSRIRIDLTDDQRRQVKEASGKDVAALEFTAQELETRIAPTTFNYTQTKWEY